MVNYFSEIKNRMLLIFFTWSHLLFTCYLYKELLLFILTQSNKPLYFIFIDVTEVFSVYVQIIFFVHIQVLTLYIFYHSFIFLGTALFYKEYRFYYSIFKTMAIVWGVLILLSIYFLIPLGWSFFLSFQSQSSINLHFEIRLREYINFFISFYYSTIVYGQVFFLVPYTLYKMNKNVKVMKKARKLFYCCFIFFSATIAPPEITSQLFISFVLIFSFELFIFSSILKHYFYHLIR